MHEHLAWMSRRDGGGAQVFICVAEGTLNKDQEEELNRELNDLGGTVLVNGRDNHFFDAGTVLTYYEKVLGPAFRTKRKQIGIGGDVKAWKGLCIPDACTSNRDKRFLPIRKQFEAQHNVKASTKQGVGSRVRVRVVCTQWNGGYVGGVWTRSRLG